MEALRLTWNVKHNKMNTWRDVYDHRRDEGIEKEPGIF